MPFKVLLVDDEVVIVGLAQATLAIDDRYEVLTANDGEQALQACREEKPDLVYLDVLMPKKNGIEVCRELREQPEYDGMKIVMLTAMSQESDRRRAFKVGADDYITKPFSPAALLGKTEELLGLTPASAPSAGR
jgi:DNA-binding response OmpR family regulator